MTTIEEEFPHDPENCYDWELLDHYTRLRARAVAMEKAAQWRPIDEAPRDGTPILVYLERPMMGSQVHAARLRPNVSTVGSLFAFDAPKQTHFRPLPPPPNHQQTKP